MKWEGFKLPMGFFICWSFDGKMAIGKKDPVTNEILEMYIFDE